MNFYVFSGDMTSLVDRPSIDQAVEDSLQYWVLSTAIESSSLGVLTAVNTNAFVIDDGTTLFDTILLLKRLGILDEYMLDTDVARQLFNEEEIEEEEDEDGEEFREDGFGFS